MNQENEQIKLIEYFEQAKFSKDLLESMYQDFISNPQYFIENESYPIIKEKILEQESRDKIHFDNAQKDFILALLAEVGFVISIIIAIKKEDSVDFEGLIKTSDKPGIIKEIKMFLVEEFLETGLEPIKNGQVDFIQEKDLPDNLPDIISKHVVQYSFY